MRQRLRLRVLLPACLVAVGGLGLMAFVGAQPGAETPLPPHVERHAAATAAPATRKGWAERANALCSDARARAARLGEPGSLSDLAALAPQVVAIEQRLLASLRAVAPPPADRTRVERVLARYERQVAADAKAVARLGTAPDATAALRLLAGSAKANGRAERLAARLGATECAEHLVRTGPAAGPLERLRAELTAHAVVVVLFYSPGSTLDALATREARAGAQDVGAGFLAVDVTNERDVAALARDLGVRDAPSVLVVRRGHGALTAIPGFADRETVAQAAADAALA